MIQGLEFESIGRINAFLLKFIIRKPGIKGNELLDDYKTMFF